MSTGPAADRPSALRRLLVRVRAGWGWVWWGRAPASPPNREQDADRARAQAEVDRLNAHRQTGRFDGGGGY